MLYYVIGFFLLAIAASVCGLGALSADFAIIGRLLTALYAGCFVYGLIDPPHFNGNNKSSL